MIRGDAIMESGKDFIKLDIAGNGVATVTLNRPKAMNSLSYDLIECLSDIFRSLDKDEKVKVIILTGAGRGFCTGVDLTAAKKVFQGDLNPEKDPVVLMERCKKPIIGAINGYAITGGFELALACDILIASSDAKFMDTHAKFGIMPSWGLSQKLSRLIGLNRSRHLSLTSMQIDAELAERWGLVSQVVPPGELMKAANAVAETILKNNEKLVLQYKAIINDGIKLPLGKGLELEKERAHAAYKALTPEAFAKMQEYISGRASKKPASKL